MTTPPSRQTKPSVPPHSTGPGTKAGQAVPPVCFAVLDRLAATAQAQTVAAGARAVVGADKLPVYAKMSQAGDVLVTLKRGEIVTIGLVLFDADVTWCAISKAGETKRLGFASCEFLEPARSSVAPEPPGLAPPPAPLPKTEPVIPPPPPKPLPVEP